ncbi:MAG: hypothetical protein JWQ76_2757, partial [Ramlibacter sp.]|nr:hypothetical protein [Ramlibacter sp.]
MAAATADHSASAAGAYLVLGHVSENRGMRLTGSANFRPIQSLRPILYRSDHLGAL